MGRHEERHSEGPQREKEAGDRGLVTEVKSLSIPPPTPQLLAAFYPGQASVCLQISMRICR